MATLAMVDPLNLVGTSKYQANYKKVYKNRKFIFEKKRVTGTLEQTVVKVEHLCGLVKAK